MTKRALFVGRPDPVLTPCPVGPPPRFSTMISVERHAPTPYRRPRPRPPAPFHLARADRVLSACGVRQQPAAGRLLEQQRRRHRAKYARAAELASTGGHQKLPLAAQRAAPALAVGPERRLGRRDPPGEFPESLSRARRPQPVFLGLRAAGHRCRRSS